MIKVIFNQNQRRLSMGMKTFNCTRLFFSLCLTLLLLSGFTAQSYGFLKGDINDDEKISLTEAVYALKVSSGVATPNTVSTLKVPSDFNSIQEAINAASQGDTIEISAGTYNENVAIALKNGLELKGAGNELTVISGVASLPTILIDHSTKITISGLSIQSGLDGI
jgi:pectin methylesterase-like acyl-CoA thioesterase